MIPAGHYSLGTLLLGYAPTPDGARWQGQLWRDGRTLAWHCEHRHESGGEALQCAVAERRARRALEEQGA